MNLASKFLGLPSRRKGRLLIAWGLMWGTRLSLWALPFGVVRAIVVPSLAPTRSPRIQTASTETDAGISGTFTNDLEEIVNSVRSVSRFVPRATCLIQALVAQRLLARAGIDSALQIGVTRGDGGLEAHAWVEHRGRAVIGDIGLDRFPRLRVPNEPLA